MKTLLLWTHIELLFFACFIACSPANEAKSTPQEEKKKFSVNFELKSDSTWQIPDQGQTTKVHLALEMTNMGEDPVRFPVMDKFRVSVKYPDGNELTMAGGQDVLIPGKPVSDPILTGQKFLLELDCRLGWGSYDQLQLTLEDGLGSTWLIDRLIPGPAMLYMVYENLPANAKNNPDMWYGKAEILSLPIRIVN